jgi:hypothetical protein
LTFGNCLGILKSLPTSLLQREEKKFLPFTKGGEGVSPFEKGKL